MDSREYIEKNRQELVRETPYELAFVEQVLARVADLDFQNVDSQTVFVDRKGSKRRIDFTISEGDHVRIALEVDGWDKTGRGTGMSRTEFIAWSRREIDMAAAGWLVLRFANTLVTRDPEHCARNIELVLVKQRSIAKRVSFGVEQQAELEQLEKIRNDALTELEEKLRGAIDHAKRSDREIRGMKTIAISFAIAVVVLVLGGIALTRYQAPSRELPSSMERSRPGGTDTLSSPIRKDCLNGIPWSSVAGNVGDDVSVFGPVVSTFYASDKKGKPTYLNIGKYSGDSGRVSIVIWGRHRDNFDKKPEALYKHRRICVQGILDRYGGAIQIQVASADAITILEK